MEGQEYYAISPDCLYENTYWTYRNLQQLCMKLSLGGRGTREELIMKLTIWHRERENFHYTFPTDADSVIEKNEKSGEIIEDNFIDDYYPMNVNGNNFSLFQVNINEYQTNPKKKRRLSTAMAFENQSVTVDPKLLRPIRINNKLTNKDANSNIQTPTKGILKKTSSVRHYPIKDDGWGDDDFQDDYHDYYYHHHQEENNFSEVNESQENQFHSINVKNDKDVNFHSSTPPPTPTPTPPTPTPTKRSKLQFSPFNGIKIISNRYNPQIIPSYHPI